MTLPALALGTQGWAYADWVGTMYDAGTRPDQYLRAYAREFASVEVDATWYGTPTAERVHAWLAAAPATFSFALKLPREITHERRLVGAQTPLEEFLDRARELGPKLGPILVQLGPDFAPSERPALEGFLALLPPDLHFAVEFRQRGWITDETHSLLTEHRVALALTESKWIPREWSLSLLRRPTADFHYLRWMGEHQEIEDFSHTQVDRTAELRLWADSIAELPSLGFTVYGYVNNHFSGHSPATVRALLRLLGERPVPPEEIADQISLF